MRVLSSLSPSRAASASRSVGVSSGDSVPSANVAQSRMPGSGSLGELDQRVEHALVVAAGQRVGGALAHPRVRMAAQPQQRLDPVRRAEVAERAGDRGQHLGVVLALRVALERSPRSRTGTSAPGSRAGRARTPRPRGRAGRRAPAAPAPPPASPRRRATPAPPCRAPTRPRSPTRGSPSRPARRASGPPAAGRARSWSAPGRGGRAASPPPPSGGRRAAGSRSARARRRCSRAAAGRRRCARGRRRARACRRRPRPPPRRGTSRPAAAAAHRCAGAARAPTRSTASGVRVGSSARSRASILCA